MHDAPIYGRIAALKLFRPRGESQDLLFILTKQCKFCILQWDATTLDFITRVMGDVSVPNACPTGNKIATISPDGRLIGLHLYDGLFTVIPFDNGKAKEAFNMRLFFEEIVDIKFLYGCKVPTIVILYQDSKKGQYVKMYELSMEYKKLTEVKWIPYRGERRVCLLIPVPPPLCGVLVIGRQWIVYCNGSYFKSSQITLSITRAYGRVHAAGDRFLLGDENGILQQLVITHENEIVTNLQITRLGETSVASTISYLDENVLYIGSRRGDSQLVQLNSEPDAKGSHVQVLDTFTNLGPIVDLCVADPKWNGQSHIVTCSGANKDSSLRVVCNGIGFKEQASLEELSGFKGLWPLRAATSDSYDKFLVISFLTETRIMSQNPEDELAECDIQGFNSQVQTLFCHTVLHNQLIQVTGNSIRLVSSNSDGLRDEWLPPADLSVTAATANTSQVLFAMGQQLVYLEIGDGELIERKRVKLDANISCLNINPIARDSNKSDIAAAGTHQRAVRIYSLPDLNCISAEQLEDCISAEQLEGYIMPCSVLLCSFEEGRILVFLVEDGELKLIEEMETVGAVYSVNAFNGKLLAAFNRKIQLYKWTSNAKPGIQKLQMECVHSGPLITRHVQTCGDLIVVGDLMKSIILLMFKNEEGAIVERARDRNENWMSAVELLEDDIYLGADISNNLLTVRNNSEGASDAECSSLEVVGEYHIGESVKRFCKCSLVRNSDIPTVLFGTKDGFIGAIASLSDGKYAFLEKLQTALRKMIKGVGGLSHEEWRSFHNVKKTVNAKNFIDGDLIEFFLHLRRKWMEAISEEMNVSVEELRKIVEELTKLY